MLVRVLEIPPSSGRFHFGGGERQTWIEVDWFRDDDNLFLRDDYPEQMTRWLKQKKYYRPDKAYLVLHPLKPFTINYETS
jgi:hypothetical protein